MEMLRTVSLFRTKGNKPLRNIQLDGEKPPFTPNKLYDFIRQGKTIVDPRTGKRENWRRFHHRITCYLSPKPGGDKKAYTRARSKHGVCAIWSGLSDRSKTADTTHFQHSGLINIDIDARPDWAVPDDITDRLMGITSFSAFGRSYSGAHYSGLNNGWANFAVELPSTLSAEELELLGMATYSVAALHDIFARAICHMLQTTFDIQGAGYADHKRLRYLLYDPNLCVNPNPVPITLEQVLPLLTELTSQQSSMPAAPPADQDWVTSCIEYANDNQPRVEGNRHAWNVDFAKMAFWLGVDKELAKATLLDRYGHDLGESPAEIERLIDDWVYQSTERNLAYFGYLSQGGFDSSLELKLAPGEYLLEGLRRTGTTARGHYIQAPTGAGKTYAMTHLFDPSENVLLLVPLSTLKHSIATKYGFTLAAKVSPSSGTSAPHRIVATFSEFERIRKKLGTAIEDYHLILDEAHYLTSAAQRSFMHRPLRAIYQHMKRFASLTCLSGTPLYTHGLDLPILKVTKPSDQKIDFTYLSIEGGVTAGVAQYVEENWPESETSAVLVWQNRKRRERLMLMGLLDHRPVTWVTTHAKAQEDFWMELATSGRFPDPVLVTTAAIKEGIDFDHYTDRVTIVIADPTVTVEDIRQVSMRFRKASHIHIRFAHGPSTPFRTGGQLPNPKVMCKLLESFALRSSKTIRSAEDLRSFRALFGVDVLSRALTGAVEVDPLRLSQIAYRALSMARTRYKHLFTQGLAEHGVDILTESETLTSQPITATQQVTIDRVSAEVMEAANEAFTQTTDKVFDLPDNIIRAAEKYAASRSYLLRMGEAESLESITAFSRHIRRSKEVFLELMPENKRFSTSYVQRLSARLYLEWLMRERPTSRVTLQVRKLTALEPGDYTSRELQLHVATILRPLERIGYTQKPYTLELARRILSPFYLIRKRRNLDEYRVRRFAIPEIVQYITATTTL